MTIIQSSNAPLWLSADGVTYKQLVCLENYTLKQTTTVNKTLTFCGLAVGVGIVEYDIQFSGVYENNKTATQVTFDDAFTWQNTGVLVFWKIIFPTNGSVGAVPITLAGQVYVTDLSVPFAVNTAVKFTGTLTGNGLITKTP
ncbi:MAG: hypothetical protein H0X33_14800 [Taibaiella sp.]|nr:hypothetical protein [Taibaiella sp.]